MAARSVSIAPINRGLIWSIDHPICRRNEGKYSSNARII